jgi:hypothetical protein
MFSIVQDKSIKKIALSSLGQYLQTSARATAYYRLVLAGENFENDSYSGLFASIPMKVPERFAAITMPALHLLTSKSRNEYVLRQPE